MCEWFPFCINCSEYSWLTDTLIYPFFINIMKKHLDLESDFHCPGKSAYLLFYISVVPLGLHFLVVHFPQKSVFNANANAMIKKIGWGSLKLQPYKRYIRYSDPFLQSLSKISFDIVSERSAGVLKSPEAWEILHFGLKLKMVLIVAKLCAHFLSLAETTLKSIVLK